MVTGSIADIIEFPVTVNTFFYRRIFSPLCAVFASVILYLIFPFPLLRY